MATVFKCDLCEEVSTYNFNGTEEYCEKCNGILYNIENKNYNTLREELTKKYGHALVAQAKILELLDFIHKEHLDSFIEYFGTQGRDLLIKALGR